MVQNINKITTNTGSVILWNKDSIIVSIPKGMYYCHMIDGIVKIKQIGVENIFNIVKTSPIDGETFPIVEDMLNKLSSFSRGGGTGAGGAKAYESLAEAMSETPLPLNGTMFYVSEGSPDPGIYAYDSENLNGYYKVSNLPEKGFNGWTPYHVFESDGAQRQVKKLTDYIGGTGDKPTQNIGQYVTDGGYTSDITLAENFKGDQGDEGPQGPQGPEVDLSDYAKIEELDNYSLTTHQHTYAELLDKPILFSGDYNDLANKPTIPTFVESVKNQNTTQPNIMFWTGTQAEYDSITVPNPDTLYFIKP